MAYTRKTRVALVKITGGDYDGLELELSLSVSMQDFIDFQKKRYGADATLDTQQEAFEWFQKNVLKAWNMVDDKGKAVPTSKFLEEEPAMVLEIITRWRSAVTELDVPLVEPSTSGREPQEVTTTTTSR